MIASKWREEDILYFWMLRGRGGVEGPGRKCRSTVLELVLRGEGGKAGVQEGRVEREEKSWNERAGRGKQVMILLSCSRSPAFESAV